MEIKRIRDNKKFTIYLVLTLILNLLVGAIIGLNYALVLGELFYYVSLIIMLFSAILGVISMFLTTLEANINGKYKVKYLILFIVFIAMGIIMFIFSITNANKITDLEKLLLMDIIASLWIIGLGVSLLLSMLIRQK